MLRIQLTGRLGQDASQNNVNGKNVINFSVAHSNKQKNKQTGEVTTYTTWVECSYWTESVGILPYLKKGTQVLVEGTPSASHYQTNSGEIRDVLRIRVMSIELLGSANQDQTAAQPAPQQATTAQHPAGFQQVNNNDDDGLSF